MKIEINNLTALIQGRDLNLYQRSLAVEEWHKLLNHVEEMEQALSLADVVGQSEQLVCDHPDEAIIRDKPTDYCLACNRNICV